ncbi:hypothetical protein VN97_g1258 [Penicillium thymicola]|uniref:Uncharacterized protein n=1 Tax=Penicillium thymicola TaxID=293382 RepID=A0AAI9TRE3_PENTH|nr:hypothetical protein VN97_g1258 [Penicillium thymicola]
MHQETDYNSRVQHIWRMYGSRGPRSSFPNMERLPSEQLSQQLTPIKCTTLGPSKCSIRPFRLHSAPSTLSSSLKLLDNCIRLSQLESRLSYVPSQL